MSRFFQLLIISAFQLFSFSAFAPAADLGQLQQSFMKRYDEANAERDQNLKKLQASYLGALKRHMDKVKASGDLARVLPVRDEIEAIEAGADPLPELPEKIDRDLAILRKKYVEARGKVRKSHAETLVALSDTMDKALLKEETDLTRAGKIDEALAAKKMRETLQNDAGIVAAKERLNDSNTAPVAFGAWIPLEEAKLKIDGERFYVGPIYGEGYDNLHPMAKKTYEWADGDMGELFIAPANIAPTPCRLTLRFPRKVSEVSGTIYLTLVGDAIFRIKVDGEVVHTHDFKGALNTDEKVKVNFTPTSKVVLEFEAKRTADDFAYTALSGFRFR